VLIEVKEQQSDKDLHSCYCTEYIINQESVDDL